MHRKQNVTLYAFCLKNLSQFLWKLHVYSKLIFASSKLQVWFFKDRFLSRDEEIELKGDILNNKVHFLL